MDSKLTAKVVIIALLLATPAFGQGKILTGIFNGAGTATNGGGGGGNTITTTLRVDADNSGSSSATPSVSATVGSTTNTLMVACIGDKLAVNPTSVTDNNCGGGGSNTWTLMDSVNDGTNTITGACYKWVATCSGTNVVTFNLTSAASDRTYISVTQHTGSSALPVVDGHANALPSGAAWTTPSVTVGTTGDMLFCFSGNTASINTYTAGSGFTSMGTSGGGGPRTIFDKSSSTVSSGANACNVTPAANFVGVGIGYALK